MPGNLLIDDNPMKADMLSRRLFRPGWGVSFAETGKAGVDCAVAREPDPIAIETPTSREREQ